LPLWCILIEFCSLFQVGMLLCWDMCWPLSSVVCKTWETSISGLSNKDLRLSCRPSIWCWASCWTSLPSFFLLFCDKWELSFYFVFSMWWAVLTNSFHMMG
jgi:hypothetical protein